MKWTLRKLNKLEKQIKQLYKTSELSENTLADVMGKIDTERFKIKQADEVILGSVCPHCKGEAVYGMFGEKERCRMCGKKAK